MRRVYILAIIAILCLTSSMTCLFVGAITGKLIFFQGAVTILILLCFVGAGFFIAQILRWMHEDANKERQI